MKTLQFNIIYCSSNFFNVDVCVHARFLSDILLVGFLLLLLQKEKHLFEGLKLFDYQS